MDELRRARDAAAAHADLVELRLDTVDRPDALGALQGRRRPVIVTCRAAWEGGGFRGSEEERERLLSEAQAGGAEFVDVEARAGFMPAITQRRRGRGIVLSIHEFGGVPGDLADRARAMRQTGAEVVKIAITAGRLADVLVLEALAVHPEFAGGDGIDGHVLLAMGQPGVPSRILAARLGNRWTYAGDEVAPGQMPAGRLLSEFRFRRIRRDAALYGVCHRFGTRLASMHMPVCGGRRTRLCPLHAADLGRLVASHADENARASSPPLMWTCSAVRLDGRVAKRVAINPLRRDGRWAPHGRRRFWRRRRRIRSRDAGRGARLGGAARACGRLVPPWPRTIWRGILRLRGGRHDRAHARGGWPPGRAAWTFSSTRPRRESIDVGVPLDGDIGGDLVSLPR